MSKTKRTRREAKRDWIAACKGWRDRLWIGDYRLNFETLDDSTPTRGESSDWVTTAKVQVQPQYRTAMIETDYDQLRYLDDDEMDEKACHEMVHVMMGEILRMGNRLMDKLKPSEREGFDEAWHVANETVTSRIAGVLRHRMKWR